MLEHAPLFEEQLVSVSQLLAGSTAPIQMDTAPQSDPAANGRGGSSIPDASRAAGHQPASEVAGYATGQTGTSSGLGMSAGNQDGGCPAAQSGTSSGLDKLAASQAGGCSAEKGGASSGLGRCAARQEVAAEELSAEAVCWAEAAVQSATQLALAQSTAPAGLIKRLLGIFKLSLLHCGEASPPVHGRGQRHAYHDL